MPEERDANSPQIPGVTAATQFTHRSGDNSVDSVDNTVNASSPRVSKRPNEWEAGTPAGDPPAERTLPGTQSDSDGRPKEGGRDLARQALAAARAKAEARGVEPGRRKRVKASELNQNSRRRRWSGPGSDARDPQPLGRLMSRLAAERGWSEKLTDSKVFGQWAVLVGEEVAEHAQPVALKDGELTVRATSTAWATQLRLLQGQLLSRIAASVGHGVVKRMRIHGPTAPSWRRGPRHISGRGPRDTYG